MYPGSGRFFVVILGCLCPGCGQGFRLFSPSRGVDWKFFGWLVSLVGMLVGVLGCPDCGACLFLVVLFRADAPFPKFLGEVLSDFHDFG